jgi:NAD(P)-dependent dehydrogenase (short-subunit alcohol dehydrogenase family)
MREHQLAAVFVEIADTLVDDFDVIEFMQLLADRSVSVVGVSAAGLLLTDQRGALRVIAASTEETKLLELFQLQSDQGPCLDCFHTGRPVVCADLSGPSARRWPRFAAEARKTGFAAVHAVPMRLRDEVIGALNLFHNRPAALPEETLALAQALADRGYGLAIDARGTDDLERARAALAQTTAVTAVAGDVADPAHRAALAAAVPSRLDALVNNASDLGPTPLPPLAELPPAQLQRVLAVNVVAPLALTQLVLPALRSSGGTVLDISSDAAVEAYEGWGGYGASKAALDQLTAVLGVEHPELRSYAVDPGDMATDMHQAAFPGEDISDRPAPETVVPGLLALVDGDLPSGRYRAADLVTAVAR